jgi:uncharacterized membrane protein AbrB (regulator of aidB expression)
VAFGVAFTSWHLGASTMLSGIVAVSSACIYLALLQAGRLRPVHLIFGMVAYGCTIAAILNMGIAGTGRPHI